MTSALGYALLGLLARRPQTGYQLAQAMRRPIGYFWTASHSQIYPELARLEADRLVRHRVVAGPGPRDTKRYSITAAGKQSLAAWATTPAPPEATRDEFLLRLYSVWLAKPGDARALVVAEREKHEAALADYQRLSDELEGRGPARPDSPSFYDRASVRRGAAFESHVVAWCTWLLDELDRAADDPNSASGQECSARP